MIKPKFITETRLAIGPVRISWPSLFERKTFEGEQGEGKFMVTGLIPKSETETIAAINKAIEAAIAQGVVSKWGGKRPAKLDTPLRDGDASEDPNANGHYTIKAKTNTRPLLTDRNGAAIVDREELYGGCWCLLSISLFPYKQVGASGVAVALNAVRKYKDDEPFGGVSAEHDFDELIQGVDDDDM